VLEDYRNKVQSWLQYNRRQTVIRTDGTLLVGLDRGPNVLVVRQFKLSEVANIDQTPLAFDFMGSKTYESKGAKTVFQKESRSGWDKRQCTLQVAAYGDGIQRCRPLLIFHGAEKGDSRRTAEVRRYHPDVEVLWNPKAWANEKTMLYWIKHI
jgi:hypothetical protein